MLTLHFGDYQIDITNAPPNVDGSADDLTSFDRIYNLGKSSYATSGHALTISQSGRHIGAALLSAGGGASGVHNRSAVIHDGTCIVAVGPFIASVGIPTLELHWATQTDDATCFGVYDSKKHNCLFSHGELLIARVTYGGKIVWQAGGADIFTNGFTLEDDVIHAFDFCDREYVIDCESGRASLA